MDKAPRLTRPSLLKLRQTCFTTKTENEASDKTSRPALKFALKEEYAFRTAQTRAREKRTTTDSCEVDKFRLLSSTWWDPDGWCRPLHSLNSLRVRLVVDGLVAVGRIGLGLADAVRPLEGVRVVDVGCGGGILCEPLARLGAR